MSTDRRPAGRLGRYWSLARRRAAQGHLPLMRQLAEIAALALITGNGPGFYQMAGFWRRSVSWQDKCWHLSAKAYRRRVETLNPPEYRKITQNKLPEKALLTLLGFPTPSFVGFLHPVSGRTHDGQPLRSGPDLSRLLDTIGERRLCFKPVEGWGGKGVELVDLNPTDRNGLLRVRTGRSIGCAAFADELVRQFATGVLIERYLEQHSEMAALNPSSVNTCRVWVARPQGGATRVLLAYLRIGRSGSVVDNQSSGGIVAPIDLETGAIGVAIDGLATRDEYPRHPDHGAQIAGREVPCWQEVMALARECLDAVPRLRFAGLDIAVAPKGPVILELNASPDREGAAYAGVPSGAVLPTT